MSVTTQEQINILNMADDISMDGMQLAVAVKSYAESNLDGFVWHFSSTGNDILDAACGGCGSERGIPKGGVVVLSGKTGSFKTYHAMEAGIQHILENPNGVVGLIDTEESKNMAYLDTLGLPESIKRRIHIIESPYGTPAIYLEHLFSTINAYIAQCETNGEVPLLIIDSISNIPTLADEGILESGDPSKFSGAKGKTLKRLTKSLPAKLRSKGISLIAISHLSQVIDFGARSNYGPRYKEDITDAFGYIANLIVRFEEPFSEDSKPTTSGYAGGMKVTEKARIRARVIKTRNNPENSVEYTIIPGYGVDNLASNLEFLASGSNQTWKADGYKAKLKGLLDQLGVPSSGMTTKLQVESAIKKFAEESSSNNNKVRQLMRPLVFECWDAMLEKNRPYKHTKYEYLEEAQK